MAASTGRGGAGNIGPEEVAKGDAPTAESLATPTIKKDIYTTGRGGSGNMAKNDKTNPNAARAAQDVNGPMHKSDPHGGRMHHGRGGEGNFVGKKEEQAAKDKEKETTGNQERKPRRASAGLLEKAREGFDKVKRGASGTRKETVIEEK